MENLYRLADRADITLSGSGRKKILIEGDYIKTLVEESKLEKINDDPDVHGQVDKRVDKNDKDSIPDIYDRLENDEDANLEEMFEEMLIDLMFINFDIIDSSIGIYNKDENQEKVKNQDEIKTEDNASVVDKVFYD